MNIELNIEDIISNEELKEIARQEIIKNLKDKVGKEADRLLSNSAYYSSFSFLNEIFTDEQKEIVSKKVTEILNDPTSYSVFNKSYYERAHGPAYYIMSDTVNRNRETIVEKTIEVISNFDYQKRLDSSCEDILKDAIIKKLEHKCD